MDFYASRLPYRSSEEERAYREGLGALPAQATWMAGLMAPSAGLSDYFGYYPEMPTAEQPIPTEYLPSFAENIENKRYLDALYQGLGVLGDVAYASTPVTGMMGPLVGATLKAGSGIGKATKGTKGTKGGLESLPESARVADELKIKRDDLMNQYGRYEPYRENIDFNFDYSLETPTEMYSPSLEALIYKAPPNLKGKQISEWLKGNTNKGVKPKELEFLDIDKITETYPDITIPELLNEVQPVKISKRYYEDTADFRFDYDLETPTRDPLDESYKLYDDFIQDINYEIENENFDDLQYFADQYARNRMTPNEIASYGDNFTFKDVIQRTRKGLESGWSNETLDEVIEGLAEQQYLKNPYKKLTPYNVGNNEFLIDRNTFAFGNEEVGYQLFVDGERVTDLDNIAYSQNEAQIQLKRAMGADDPDMYSPGGAMYKGDIDENLPGGSNYQEVVFRWDDAPDGGHKVYMTHFDDDNQIAHALTRDRILDDGSSTKHIDELQSDVHKQGSRHGYVGDENYIKANEIINSKLPEYEKNINDLLDIYESQIELSFIPSSRKEIMKEELLRLRTREMNQTQVTAANIDSDRVIFPAYMREFGFEDVKTSLRSIRNDLQDFGDDGIVNNLINKTSGLESRAGRLRTDMYDLIRKNEKAVPNIPYKDDYYKMGIKNLLLDAIDEGKDAISISRSEAMVDRYVDQYETFYETLYDKKIPSFMKKLANQYGGNYREGSLDVGDILGAEYVKYGGSMRDPEIAKATIIEITPEMKAKILEEGLPTFKRGGEVRSSLYDIDIFDTNTLRPDGTKKSMIGWQGPIRNEITGKTMTELSIGGEGGEPLRPLINPLLSPEEMSHLIQNNYEGRASELKKTEIGKRMLEKANQWYIMRSRQGLSPFYDDDNPEMGPFQYGSIEASGAEMR